jgi:hypothetical protein
MPTIIDNRKETLDQTVRIFDAFYNAELNIPSNEWDVVYGYFKTICETDKIAGNLASSLFRVTQLSGVPAIDLLQIIQGKAQDKLQLNSIMCYYLNSVRSKTALYGVATIPMPNEPVARNVVQ